METINLDTAMAKNRFCHVEIPVTDIGRARGFYEKLFDWKIEQTPDPGYALFPGGGLRKVDRVAGGGAINYVCVDNLEKYLDKVKNLGGRVEINREPAGDGWCALFKDLDGNTVGLYTH